MSDSLVVDIISDLNLDTADNFTWENKPTALFCIVAGGISKNIQVVESILESLSRTYRGVFYIDGRIEHSNIEQIESTVDKLSEVCSKFTNVIYLHQHVVVLNGVAFVGLNGWSVEDDDWFWKDRSILHEQKLQDIAYLSNAIKNLQNHREVTRIVVVSACIPSESLLCTQSTIMSSNFEPALTLIYDDAALVKTWVFSGSSLQIDVTCNNRRFVNNPCHHNSPYWPKRITV